MSDNLPLSFAIVNTKSVLSVAFARVTDGIVNPSFCTKDLPL